MQRLLAFLRRALARLRSRGRCDPTRLLQQSVRDREDRIPALKEALAMLQAQVVLAGKEVERLRAELAANDGPARPEVEAELARKERDLHLARASLELAREHERAFVLEQEEAIRAAKGALAATRQAEWSRRVARALRAFEAAERGAGREDERAAIARFKADAAASEAELREVLERLVARGGAGPEALRLAVGAAREEVEDLARRLERTRERLRACEARLGA